MNKKISDFSSYCFIILGCFCFFLLVLVIMLPIIAFEVNDKLLKSTSIGCIETINLSKKLLPYLGIKQIDENLIFASQTNFYSWKEREGLMEHRCHNNDTFVSFVLFENNLVFNRRIFNDNLYKYETYIGEYPCSYDHRIDLNDSLAHYRIDSRKNLILAAYFSNVYNFTKSGTKISSSQLYKQINCLIVLKKRDKIAISHPDGSIRIHSSRESPIFLTTTDLVVELTVLAELIDFSLAAGYGSTIKVWNIDTRKIVYELSGHSDSISALTSLPSGLLLSGSADTTIKMWNTITRLLVRTLQGHTSTIKSFAVYPNYNLKFASLDEDTVKIWA